MFFFFLAKLVVCMQCGVKDVMKYYWSALEETYVAFYNDMMKQDQVFHIGWDFCVL